MSAGPLPGASAPGAGFFIFGPGLARAEAEEKNTGKEGKMGIGFLHEILKDGRWIYWIDTTRSGLPALWEEGGGRTNTGSATIIAGPDGRPLRPTFVRRKGHRACGKHALFIARPGLYIVQAEHHRGDFTLHIWKIEEIPTPEQAKARGWYEGRHLDPGHFPQLCVLREVAYVSPEVSRGEIPDFLEAAVKAAKQKALCYHCREPHYARLEANKP